MPDTSIRCRIFQPPKSSMQSGRAMTHHWVLEYEDQAPRRPEPLMGWTSGDTLNQIRLRFPTKEEAISFAERKDLDYSVEEPKPHRVQPRTYADNFRYVPPPKPAAAETK